MEVVSGVPKEGALVHHVEERRDWWLQDSIWLEVCVFILKVQRNKRSEISAPAVT